MSSFVFNPSSGANAAGPTGMVAPFAGADAPSGWLLCDNSEVSRSAYAALFAVIGTTYGTGDGSTTFNLPDLRGNVVAGKDDMGGTPASRISGSGSSPLDGTVLGNMGGNQVPQSVASHTHTVPTLNSSPNGVTAGGDFEAVDTSANGGSYNADTAGPSTSDASGENQQSLQPTIILNYIIKT